MRGAARRGWVLAAAPAVPHWSSGIHPASFSAAHAASAVSRQTSIRYTGWTSHDDRRAGALLAGWPFVQGTRLASNIRCPVKRSGRSRRAFCRSVATSRPFNVASAVHARAEVRNYFGGDRRAFGGVERLTDGDVDVVRGLPGDVAVHTLTGLHMAVVGLDNESDQ